MSPWQVIGLSSFGEQQVEEKNMGKKEVTWLLIVVVLLVLWLVFVAPATVPTLL